MRELPNILQLDISGNPQRWITYEDSCYYTAKDLVGWSMGATNITLYGGTSRETGKQSTMTINTIIAIKGKVNPKQFQSANRVPLSNKTLFRRDSNMCAYCGETFNSSALTRDHIHPVSRGGPNIWMNVVASCSHCNKVKDDRTPEEANMQLLFTPYIPNRAEWLILQNRKILGDQMEFLLARVPQESRLLVA